MNKQNIIKPSLKILHLENSKRDFEIIRKLLIGEGYDLKMDRVKNEQGFVSALSEQKYNIILSDFKLSEYDAFAALKKSHEICPDVPFIVVSRNSIDVSAIELIKQGAEDYVQKDNLERLPIAIERVLEEASKDNKAEEALRETNARHAAMIANISDIIAIMGADGTIKYQSPNIEKYFGWKPEEIIGTISFENVHPEDIEKTQKEFSKILEKKSPVVVEFRHKCKDGTYKWIELTAANHINDPSINGVLINYHDITERKQADEENIMLSKIPSENLHPVLRVKQDGTVLYANGPSKLLMQHWNCSVGEKLSTSKCELVAKLYKNTKLEVISVEVGEHIYSLVIVPIAGAGYVNIYGSDITERKKSENELRESEERFRRLFNDLGDAVFVTKIGGTDSAQILEVNPAAEKQTGYTRDDLLKMNIARDLSVIGSSESRLVDWDEALLNGQKVSSVEKKRRKDNTEYWTEVVVTPIDFKGEKACLSINHDITERKQAENALIESEAQLRELNATKDKFFRIIAHDLKSPFNSILGFSSLLIEEIQEKDYERIEEFAGYIKSSSHRAMDLLMNLMEWSQLQTGKMEFTPHTIDLHELINEIIELLNDAAQLKSITISTELPDDIHVSADKAMLGTILRNLVSNAIKFTYADGKIVISAEQKLNEWVFCVSDSGVGIMKENIDKLFRIKESLSTVGTQQEKGTGLGLILCKEFVEQHGGRIWVESQYGNLPDDPPRKSNSEAGKAGGSQFYFTLPKNK